MIERPFSDKAFRTASIESTFKVAKKPIDLLEIRKSYYKLIANDEFETVYPSLKYNSSKQSYRFELQALPHNNFKIDVGGVVSSRPINNTYLGFQYNLLKRTAYTFGLNFFLGRFYESFQGTARMDFPTRLPFYIQGEYTYNDWDYFNASKIFIVDSSPIFVDQSDRKAALKMGIPLLNNGKVEVQVGYADIISKYSPIESYEFGNQLDFDSYRGGVLGLSFQKYTLNRPQYASYGTQFLLDFNYYWGQEEYIHGNILQGEPGFTKINNELNNLSWFKATLKNEQYFLHIGPYALGYLLEGVVSNKPFFSTYQSTLISAPAFYPLQDSKSLLLENFRANTYGAVGLKNIFSFTKNFDLRLEGYAFQPFRTFQQAGLQSIEFSNSFPTTYYAATADLIYRTLVGPISLSFNHYTEDKRRFGVLFHIGFLLYNKRSID